MCKLGEAELLAHTFCIDHCNMKKYWSIGEAGQYNPLCKLLALICKAHLQNLMSREGYSSLYTM